ncbi:MAG: ABC transporter substrate-binding protein [Candidatus Electrothrix communis]|nr:MAG: ABC transporter substrate-binding protein [Candidatus Electrothrix communis]
MQDKLAKKEEQVRFFNPAEFGVNFVANSIITSEKMVKEHPRVVGKFLAALLQGWEVAMNLDNEDKVLADAKKIGPLTCLPGSRPRRLCCRQVRSGRPCRWRSICG